MFWSVHDSLLFLAEKKRFEVQNMLMMNFLQMFNLTDGLD